MASIQSSQYQPSPRFYHYAGQVGGKSYMWGGRTQVYHQGHKERLKSTVNIFNPYLETWQEQRTTGMPPGALYTGACAAHSKLLYSFGGFDEKFWYNCLHVLDTNMLVWRDINNPTNSPMRKSGCGMVFYDNHCLATIGGYGLPTYPLQTGSYFCKNLENTEGAGWTDEFHIFDVLEGKWSSPPTTGPRPPPGASFSFTAIDEHQAVMFGGFQPEHGIVDDVYIIDFSSMEWTKLERPEGAPWPVGRIYHAACCLTYGEDQPVLLISGGIDQNNETLGDAWLLDVHSGKWTELTLPEDTQPRWGHTLTACRMNKSQIHATTFGGCPSFDPNRSHDDDPKLADTTILEFESVEPQFGGTPSSRQWVLVCVADSSQLGIPERTRLLEKLTLGKTEHEIENTQEQQVEVRQMKEKVAAAETQAKLFLDRAMKAEQKADQVQVLEKNLSETKANLEEKIRMQDEVRVAEQKQFHQTRVALEHQILVRDQANAALGHQIEVKEQARVFIEQQFDQMKWTLEHELQEVRVTSERQLREKERERVALELQLHEKEQARVDLETQIRAKDQEKRELEQQLHRKDEHIRTLQVPAVARSQGAADQVSGLSGELFKLSQVDSSTGVLVAPYAPTSQNTAVEVAEVQKLGGEVQVIAQEEVAIAPQTRKDIEAGEELRQAREPAAKLIKEQVNMMPTSASISSPALNLRGASVIAQRTFTITQESQSLQFQGYGFKLHVPEGSIPAEVAETKLNVQVSLSGQFQMPPGYELLSAVYWVYCPHKFTKPLTVEIQHCAVLSSDQQCTQLSFASTKCSQKELPYMFKVRDGGAFSHHSSYGSLSLTHFSGFAIIANFLRRSLGILEQYCGRVYISKEVDDYKVHFVITKDLDAQRTVVEEHYSTKLHFTQDIEIIFEFDGEMITLSIPRSGEILESGWKVQPRYDPTIRKGNVDRFSEGQTIPKCELLLRWPHRDKPHVCLEHEIKLIGANGCSFFTLYIPDSGMATPNPAVSSPSSGSIVPSPRGAIQNAFSSESVQQETNTLGIEDLVNITSYLHPLGRPAVFNLGLILGLSYRRLKDLIDSSEYCTEMLAGWLQQVDKVEGTGIPTWGRLVEALRDPRVGQNGVANNILVEQKLKEYKYTTTD